jgi:hypothetical protein
MVGGSREGLEVVPGAAGEAPERPRFLGLQLDARVPEGAAEPIGDQRRDEPEAEDGAIWGSASGRSR